MLFRSPCRRALTCASRFTPICCLQPILTPIALAIGVEMPLLINFAILLDILISVLMLGIFFTKIDGKLHADDADSLTNVKD